MRGSRLIVDLGGGSIKLGLASDNAPTIVDNCIYKAKNTPGRNFIGREIEDCLNLSSLFGAYPLKKGYIHNWDIQKQILDSVFKRFRGSKNPSLSDFELVVTEPYFNFTSTKETMNEVFFEDYQVAGLLRANPAFFGAYKYRQCTHQRSSRYCLIIDSGYSFTHILPFADGEIMKEYALRLAVGGKILTNRLIEVTSYRQLDVRSEVYIMNQCKEDSCFVSVDFWSDLSHAKSRDVSVNNIVREYVLPDYVDVHRGYLRNPLEKPKDSSDRARLPGYTLRLANERFTIPELLFHPTDVGYTEMGISEAADYLLTERLPPGVRPGAMANCILIGGNAKFAGFNERILNDLRSSVPTDLSVNVFTPPDPQIYAWQGAALLASNRADYDRYLVTRKEYEENGHAYCESRFPVT